MACMIGQFHSLPLTLLLPYLSSQYNKNYDTDDEYQKRLETFMKNVIFIDNFSKEKHSYECAWMVIRACLFGIHKRGERENILLSPPKPKFHCTKLHTLTIG